MKSGLKKKQKVTEVYFNASDAFAEGYTHDTELKKRLTAYAAKYPELCKQTDDDEQGGLRFEIDKHRISIRLTAPIPKNAGTQPAVMPRKIVQSSSHKEDNMEKYIYDERNGLHYELAGDYYLPCLAVPETPELGVWGRRRLNHLQMHRQPIYTGMLLSGKLDSYLEGIDHTAAQRHDLLIQQMSKAAGITEELKAIDQMAWVQQMNAVKAQVSEIICEELIYA